MRVVYERALRPHEYRAVCTHCDWWENADSWGEIGRCVREHLRDADLDSEHDEAIVVVSREIGTYANDLTERGKP